MALVNEGDEVILPSPYWVSYSDMTQLFGGVPKVITSSLESDFKITPDQLEEAITYKNKMELFISPSKSCWSVYSKVTYFALIDEVCRFHIYFVIYTLLTPL